MLDTSYLLNRENVLDVILENHRVIIHIVVIEELDHLKQHKDPTKAFRARRVIKTIESNKDKDNITFIFNKHIAPIFTQGANSNIADNVNDNIIVSCAWFQNAFLATDDLNLRIKAKALGVKIFEDIRPTKDRYKGYIDVVPTDEEWNNVFEDKTKNIYNCLCNQFVVMRNAENEIASIMRWNGSEYEPLNYKTFKTDYIGDVQPKNTEQKLAMDILQNKDITVKVLTGCQGTGKDFLMIAHALYFVRGKKFQKIVWVRNNVEVKDSKPIGFLPDGIKDKLLPFAKIIADHVGGEQKLLSMINMGQIEIEHLGFIRGRDIKNSIIICSEAENMTKEQVALLVGRVGENSTLWINGDYEQVDDGVYEKNNGLLYIIDKLKGHEAFGYINLKKVERSKTAGLSKLLK